MAETDKSNTEQMESPAGDRRPAASGDEQSGFDASAFLNEAGSPWYKRAPIVPLLLGFNTLLVCFLAAVLIYALTGDTRAPERAHAHHTAETPVVSRPDGAEDGSGVEPPRVAAQAWQKAEAAFREEDYTTALGYYRHLLDATDDKPVDPFVTDYLRMRSGRCLIQLGSVDQARSVLERAARSGSPIVRAVANYYLAEVELRAGRHSPARRRAYAAIASLGAMEMPQSLERDCDYLIARTLTETTMTFLNADEPIPWPGRQPSDPFAGLDDAELRRLLHDGSERLSDAVLGPRVEAASRTSAGRFWSVGCWEATLEEVLYRFASAAGTDLRWATAAPPVRQRGVTLAFRSESEHRIFEVACGVAGLVARFARGEVLVHDPDAISSLSEKSDLFQAEAVSAWRRFFLRAPDDRGVPAGHFALGRLYEGADEVTDAMREYRLLASRFPRNELAPRSLMRKARIQISLRDYAGARADLVDLLDLYPDYPAVDNVYLYLGRSALETGLWDEAIRTFRKLYYMNLSKASRLEACRGVARAHFEQGNYTEAVEWYERYFRASDDPTGEPAARAFLNWGMCEFAMGNLDKAAAAMKLSLGAEGPRDMRIRASLTLAEVEFERQNFLAALGLVNDISGERLNEQQTFTRLRLRTMVLREMGAPFRARRMLTREVSEVSDEHLRALLAVEAAECLVAEDNRAEARAMLSDALGNMRPSPESHEAALLLARLSLEDGRYRQAAEVAETLLETSCPAHIRRQAEEILGMARAYLRDYEGAAEALSGGGVSADVAEADREATQ